MCKNMSKTWQKHYMWKLYIVFDFEFGTWGIFCPFLTWVGLQVFSSFAEHFWYSFTGDVSPLWSTKVRVQVCVFTSHCQQRPHNDSTHRQRSETDLKQSAVVTPTETFRKLTDTEAKEYSVYFTVWAWQTAFVVCCGLPQKNHANDALQSRNVKLVFLLKLLQKFLSKNLSYEL